MYLLFATSVTFESDETAEKFALHCVTVMELVLSIKVSQMEVRRSGKENRTQC